MGHYLRRLAFAPALGRALRVATGRYPPARRLDDGRPWPGKYTRNTGQRVSAPDAAGLALGLRAALGFPEFDGLVVAFGDEFRGQCAAASTPTVSFTVGPFPPAEWKHSALEFAVFCEGGGFSIH
ncbi:MAG: hypothetical protein JSS02_26320 [Planctomycetes bacterium]|nr:hypothetical protein [Planctomycetota bacterium]